jgi:hypothetical protein
LVFICPFFLKGIVQQESTGVESCISQKVFLSHCPADILFLFKENLLFKLPKIASAAQAKICGLSNSMGPPTAKN